MIYKIDNRPNRNKNKYIVLGIVLGIVLTMGGFYVYGNYQSTIIQNANLIKDTAISEIPKISMAQNNQITTQDIVPQTSQSSNSAQSQYNNYANRTPITFYENCSSFIRTDVMKDIQTTCHIGLGQKNFRFNLPTVIEQAIPNQELILPSKLYQYGANDFELGLIDQVGQKNYTVTLWQLP